MLCLSSNFLLHEMSHKKGEHYSKKRCLKNVVQKWNWWHMEETILLLRKLSRLTTQNVWQFVKSVKKRQCYRGRQTYCIFFFMMYSTVLSTLVFWTNCFCLFKGLSNVTSVKFMTVKWKFAWTAKKLTSIGSFNK